MSINAISPSLKLRLLSGIILAPVFLILVYYSGWPLIGLVLILAAIAVYEWHCLCKGGENYIGNLIMGLVYILICFGAFLYLRFEVPQGHWLTLAVVVAVWASDTGAYFTGKTIGGTKLAPKISPNKTWAGLGGAMFFCALALVLFYNFSPLQGNLILLFVIGLFLGFVGQGGDLFVSSMKRRVGLKDTGHLIPGHGGLLDRVDSLMLVTPTFLFIDKLWLN